MEELKVPVAIDLKAAAVTLADELRREGGPAPQATGGGSLQRALPAEMYARFIGLRTALIQRGIFDPVLLRFDTASAPLASNGEIAEELAKIAEML